MRETGYLTVSLYNYRHSLFIQPTGNPPFHSLWLLEHKYTSPFSEWKSQATQQLFRNKHYGSANISQYRIVL